MLRPSTAGYARLSLLAIILLVLAASCNTSQRAVKTDSPALSEWHDISVPVNVALHSPRQFSTGSVNMYMVKGEEITFSMRFLGMVVGAIHITPDSLMAYSVPQRIYVAEDLASALGGVSLPLTDIQDLLIGQSFPDFDRLPGLGATSVFTIDTQSYPLTDQPQSLTVAQTSPDRRLTLEWSRDDSRPSLPFAPSLSLTLTGSSAPAFSATLTYSWSRATIDSNAERRFKLPSSYKRVAARDLLKAFTAN